MDFDQVELWAFLHATTGIICACLPTYRPLAAKAAAVTTKLRQRYGSWSRLVTSSKQTDNGLISGSQQSKKMGGSGGSSADYVYLTDIQAGHDGREATKPGINVQTTFQVNP